MTFADVHHYFDGPESLPLPNNVLPSWYVQLTLVNVHCFSRPRPHPHPHPPPNLARLPGYHVPNAPAHIGLSADADMA